MIRNLILSTMMAVGTISGLALSPSLADAHPPVAAYRHRFEVLVWCGHRWEGRGTYWDRFEADWAAAHLRHDGFRVEVRD
jgi:hypothetical protein